MALASPVVAQSGKGETAPLDCTIEPKTIARIGSPDEGVIETIEVERGDVVEAGQVLAALESRTEKLAVDLARLQAVQDVDIRSQRTRLAFQREERQRAEELFNKKLLSDKQLDEATVQETIARLDLESAALERKVAEVQLALAEARLERRTIRSPMNAIVIEVSKAPGEYIHEQAPLATLAQIDELYVEVFVPVRRFDEVRSARKAIVQPVQPIGGQYEAEVEVVDRMFDAASSTFGVRLRLPNPDGTLPAGIRCSVRFLAAAG
jgi:RND family efflux transporter MFP subunit